MLHFRHHRECHSRACARAADDAYNRVRERRRRAHERWLARHRPTAEAGASWYDDGGGTACGFHAKLGVANKTLPCHTRVQLCASRCAVVEVQDRGPFIAGREWDLNPGAKEAIGFGDTGSVRWRLVRK